jgi:hypothetical protein
VQLEESGKGRLVAALCALNQAALGIVEEVFLPNWKRINRINI